MIYSEGGDCMSCTCDCCGATERGITMPCSNGTSYWCDGYDERPCEDASEVCEVLFEEGWRANTSAQFCPDCRLSHPKDELDELELVALAKEEEET